MCNYHIWFHDEKAGYVVECKQCNRMQLCFGNILIGLDKPGFKNFCDYISIVQQQKEGCIDRHTKSIVLSTQYTGISFILTATELNGLCCMLDYVDTEIKTTALIKMFAAAY
ncbi:MAG TPA: DUF6686 family protein [Ferruginibacter sp.]|nr:DUF6686 family protein [Ferruginibacter sp.]